MAERGDLLAYELDIGFNLNSDKASKGLLGLSDQFTYLESQSKSLSKNFESEFGRDYSNNFVKISEQLEVVQNFVGQLTPDFEKHRVSHELLNDQLIQQNKLQDTISTGLEDQRQSSLGIIDNYSMIAESLGGIFADVVGKITSLDVAGAGRAIVTGLSKGIDGSSKIAFNATNRLTKGIDAYFPHSPALMGALSTIMSVGGSIVNAIAKGIAGAAGIAWSAAKWLVSGIANIIWSGIKMIGNFALDMLKKSWGKILVTSEKFHRLTYRNYGSINDLTGAVMRAASTYGVMTDQVAEAYDELMKSRIVVADLAVAGASGEEGMMKLAAGMSMLNRMTGVAYTTTANYTRIMQRSGMGLDGLERKYRYLANTMRKFSLTSQELNNAMNVDANTEWTMLGRFGKEGPAQLADIRVGLQAISASARLPDGVVEAWTSVLTSNLDIQLASQRHGHEMADQNDNIASTLAMVRRMRDEFAMQDGNPLFNAVEAQEAAGVFGITTDQAIKLLATYEAMDPAMRDNIKSVEDFQAAIKTGNLETKAMYDESKGLGYNWQLFMDRVQSTFGKLLVKFLPLLDKIVALMDATIIPALSAVMDASADFLDLFSTAPDAAAFSDGIGKIFDNISAKFSSMPLVQNGIAFIKSFAQGIITGFPTAINMILTLFKDIAAYLPNSDAEKGPFSRLTWNGMQLIRTLGEGVISGAGFFLKSLLGSLAPNGLGSILGGALAGPLKIFSALMSGDILGILQSVMGLFTGKSGLTGMITSSFGSVFGSVFDTIKNVMGLFMGSGKSLTGAAFSVADAVLGVFNNTAGKFMDVGFFWVDSLLKGLGMGPVIGHVKDMFKSVGQVFLGSPVMGAISATMAPLTTTSSKIAPEGGIGGVLQSVTDMWAESQKPKSEVSPIITVKPTSDKEDSVKADATIKDVVTALKEIQDSIDSPKDKGRSQSPNSDTYLGRSEFNTTLLTNW